MAVTACHSTKNTNIVLEKQSYLKQLALDASYFKKCDLHKKKTPHSNCINHILEFTAINCCSCGRINKNKGKHV